MAIKAFRRPGTVVALVLALSFGLCSALTPALAQSDDFERLKAAVEKARQAGKKDDLALKLYTLGQTLAEARKFEEALTYLREALSVDRGLAKSKEVFNDLIAIARVETHAKQFEQAEKTYLEALAVAKDTGSEKQLASVYAGLGANAIHAKKFEEARTFYEKSREEAARSSDYVGECQARLSLAMLLKREGKLAEALKELEAARALLGDNTQEAFVGQVLKTLAEMKEFSGDTAGAIEAYGRAAAIFRECGEGEGEAICLFNLANNLLAFGKPKEALAQFEKAHSLFDQESNTAYLARVLVRQGTAYADMGNFVEAERLHVDAMNMAKGLKDADLEALAGFELAYDYYLEGALDKALERWKQLEKQLRGGAAVSDADILSETERSIAMCYRNMGQPAAAIDYFERAAKRLRDAGNLIGEIACLNSIACTSLDFERGAEYGAKYKQVQALMEKVPALDKGGRDFRRLSALVLFNHGQFELIGDHHEAALADYLKAADDFASVSDKSGQLRALTGIGLCYLKKGGAEPEFRQAISYFEKAEPLALASGNTESQWDCAYGLGSAYLKLGDKARAESYLRKAISLFEKEKEKHGRDDSKTYALDLRGRCFQELVSLLFTEGRLDEALETAERGRARAFLDLLEGRRSTGTHIALTGDSSGAAPGQAPKRLAEIAMADTGSSPFGRDRSVEVISKSNSLVLDSAVSQASAKAPDVQELKALVAESGSTVVEYFITADKLYTFVIGGGAVKAPPPVAISEAALTAKVTAAYKSIISPPEDLTKLQAANEARQKLLQDLYKLLVEPIKPYLPAAAESVVTIVPHGALFKVPFAALTDGSGKLFVEDHTLAVVPAVGVFRATHKLLKEAPQGKDSLLAFGNPTMNASIGLGALPYSEKEVKKISELFGAGSIVKVGADASRANLKELAPKASIIHLATHGLIDEERPMDSAVLLASSSSDDGLFTVKDILQMPALKARLITLSACQTGRGKISGDGVAGLSRAFILAGTPSVMVSLWNVDDVMTEYQMSAFYQSLLGGAEKALALRQAQLKTVAFMEKGMVTAPGAVKVRANPRYWAAFQMIGEHK